MSDARTDLYVSTDIETDGPIPGANSRPCTEQIERARSA
jgi:hypothetical protein